jgi:hypothetical protein
MHIVETGSVAYPVGTRGCVSGGKVAGLEAGHSPPTIADINKTWIYTSTPPYVLVA